MLIAGTAVWLGEKAKPSLSPKSIVLSPHPTPRACRGYLRHPGLAGAFSSAEYCRGEEHDSGEKDANVPFILDVKVRSLPRLFSRCCVNWDRLGDLRAAWLPHPSSCNRKCSWEGEVSGLVPQSPGKPPQDPLNPCKGAVPGHSPTSSQSKPNHPSKFHNSFGSLETELPTCLP